MQSRRHLRGPWILSLVTMTMAATWLAPLPRGPRTRGSCSRGNKARAKASTSSSSPGTRNTARKSPCPSWPRSWPCTMGSSVRVLFAINKKDGMIDPMTLDNIPGLEALEKADLMVLFTRFRELPDEQMKRIIDYTNSGRPIVALRTATHPFSYAKHKDSPYAKYSFNNRQYQGGYGRQVLGETWVNHYGAPSAREHPRADRQGDGEPSDRPRLRRHLGAIGRLRADHAPGRLQAGHHGPGAQGDEARRSAQPRQEARARGVDQDLHGERREDLAGLHDHDGPRGRSRRARDSAACWSTPATGAWAWKTRFRPGRRWTSSGRYEPVPIGYGKYKKGLKPADYRL